MKKNLVFLAAVLGISVLSVGCSSKESTTETTANETVAEAISEVTTSEEKIAETITEASTESDETEYDETEFDETEYELIDVVHTKGESLPDLVTSLEESKEQESSDKRHFKKEGSVSVDAEKSVLVSPDIGEVTLWARIKGKDKNDVASQISTISKNVEKVLKATFNTL